MSDSVRDFALSFLRNDAHVAIPADVTDDIPLGANGIGLDSFVIIEMAVHAEDHFDVEVVDELVGNSSLSLGEFVACVERSRRA